MDSRSGDPPHGGPRKPSGPPEALTLAYDGLRSTVVGILIRRVPYEDVGRTVTSWLGDDCGGSAELARSAIHALRHEISARPPRGDPDGGHRVFTDEAWRDAESSALALVEYRLEEKLERENALKALSRAEVEEVDPPAEVFRAAPGTRAFRVGDLRVQFSPARPTGDDATPYLRVTHPDRYPLWEEVLLAAAAVVGEDSRPELWARLPRTRHEEEGPPWAVRLYVDRSGGSPGTR